MEQERQDKEKGSAIIETVLCLTVFITAIFTILSFINLCRAQAMMAEAVDATAKELSQYAYFWNLTGLDDLERNLYEDTGEARDKLGNVVESVQALYDVLNTAKGGEESTSAEGIAGKVEAVFDGISDTAGIDSIVTDAVTVGSTVTVVDGAALADGIKNLGESLKAVDNPLALAKSLLTVAALKGSSMSKSRLIAAPLAKVLIRKHFEAGGENADDYLRKFHIDGMDALNFNMSEIFDVSAPDDIHLVLYYRLKPINFFNFEFSEIVLKKEAVTRAWLGGD